MAAQEFVQKLWNLCHILRDDGVTYHQYVNELSYLLFLKMAQETGTEAKLPRGYRWYDLAAKNGDEQFNFYRLLLVELGTSAEKLVRTIFANPTSLLHHARSLKALVAGIDALDWFSARQEGLGELYEGLLQRNAHEQKSGAGQYFTPRPLVEAIVSCIRPTSPGVIQDPALGTAGFLIVADQYLRKLGRNLQTAYIGVELNQDVHRLALMNVMLHEMKGEIHHGDALSSLGAALPMADMILTNPPFGTKRGTGGPSRTDLPFPTNNKQLAFLQHVCLALKPGGRAAVVVPDNVLFEDGVGLDVRRLLMSTCNLHTMLRLPAGIFYAAGVRTNVLFFTKNRSDQNKGGGTRSLWIYDLRNEAPAFGKRKPLTLDFFKDFIAAYGDDPDGRSRRVDTGDAGRFRRFSRKWIRTARGDNLDIAWLKNSSAVESLDIEELVAEVLAKLAQASEEVEALVGALGKSDDVEMEA